MSNSDYREKLRAMAQEERERMNDFILSEARRKEQRDLEPEQMPEPDPAPVVVHEPEQASVVTHKPEPEPVAVVVEPPKPKPEPDPDPKATDSEPETKTDKKRSFNFIARGEVVDWLLYKRAKGYNCSSLIKRILAEYMAKDEGWIRYRSGGHE